MTVSITADYSQLDLDELLKSRRQVAVIWGIEDVHSVRDDLTDDEAWEVLLECRDQHDCEWGFTWTFIQDIAQLLFPQPKK